MSPESLHRIAEPLLTIAGLSALAYAVAMVVLWRHGRRMKAKRD